MRILLVEDDLAFAGHVTRRLRAEESVVVHVDSVAEAQLLIDADEFTAVMLDMRMPDGSGVQVLRQIRARDHAVPVMVVSGVDAEEVIIRVLDAGADDYVCKPVTLDLLMARLRALVRRGTAAAGPVHRIGALVVDPGRLQAWADGVPVHCSSLEFKLLTHLAARPAQVMSRESLLRDVWGMSYTGGSNVVDVAIKRLRLRLGMGATLPVIESICGVGYVLQPPPE